MLIIYLLTYLLISQQLTTIYVTNTMTLCCITYKGSNF